MKYLVIGAGGTGGCIGGFMHKAGKDVTIIARGAHLEAIQNKGLTIETPNGSFTTMIPAFDMDNYNDKPDVVFVCVKGYSIEDAISFIGKVAKEDTIVIPILNIYGTGGKMQEKLPNILVTDGCIYVASQIKEYGCIQMNGAIFRVVFGVRNASEYDARLEIVEKDLADSNITPLLSDNIQRDALKKFSYVSPAAACGQYYNIAAGPMQVPGEKRDTFIALIKEIEALAKAMGIDFGEDMVKTNTNILDNLTEGASTSMQRDIEAGKSSEWDGLICEVVRLGEKYGVDVPTYKMISEAFSF
ncbi:MAG: 2-dehydropantoate 2-reductase [Lachnospiraceae bacterium]|nr:2-dehydropantoate 2-reductase [Lachnospiraceae bacterium]